MPDSNIKRFFRLLIGWPAIAALAASCLVMQPGNLGADDRSVFNFTFAMVEAHFRWNVFLNLVGGQTPANLLNHDYAVFLAQVAVYWPYWLLSHILHALNSPVVLQIFMAVMFNLPIWIAIWAGWKILRAVNVGEAFCVLILAGIFGGSYATSALAGTPLNNIEALFVLLQLLLVSRERTSGNAVTLGLTGGYLVALRPYDAVNAMILLLLSLRGRHRLARIVLLWGLGFAAAIAVGFVSKFLLPVPARDYVSYISPAPGTEAFLPVYVGRWMAALFSFAYGIPWTMPFLLFALASPDKSALPAKLFAILTVLAVTTLFPFWPGNALMAGNRYMFAQILLLLPEAGLGFQHVVRRFRYVVMVVPVLVILFLPSIAFRHNVTYDYAVGEPDTVLQHPVVGHPVGALQESLEMPIWNPLLHPALFAWWQMYALMRHAQMMLPVGSSEVSLDPWLVPPYGLLPRLIYIRNVNAAQEPDTRVIAAQRFVALLPSWMLDLVFALSALAGLFWASLIALAMRIVFLEPPLAPSEQTANVAKAGS